METPPRRVRLEQQGSVSVVTLQRPQRLNAISLPLLQDLHEALVAAHADAQTRCIVFTGAGRAFCAGDDLKEFEAQATAETMAAMGERIQQITRDLMLGPKLVVGACHGYAVGGGFEWMLNCDLVVAADDLVAFFPEMALGHFVTGGVTHLLPQAVGPQRAMELLVLGERQNAAQLLQLGLVNRVVPQAQMLPVAMELAREIGTRATHATARLKKVMHAGLGAQLETALRLEQQAALECFAHPETAARVGAFAGRG
jgi:enoyl-CoA hydratase/carnithine racemase